MDDKQKQNAGIYLQFYIVESTDAVRKKNDCVPRKSVAYRTQSLRPKTYLKIYD